MATKLKSIICKRPSKEKPCKKAVQFGGCKKVCTCRWWEVPDFTSEDCGYLCQNVREYISKTVRIDNYTDEQQKSAISSALGKLFLSERFEAIRKDIYKDKIWLRLETHNGFWKKGRSKHYEGLDILEKIYNNPEEYILSGDKDINIDVSYASVKKIKWVHYVTVA